MNDQIKIGDKVEFTAFGEWVKGTVTSYDDDFGFYTVTDDAKTYSVDAGCFKTVNGEQI